MKHYRLYIDESGDHSFGRLDEPGRQHLCLLGIVIDVEKYRSSFHLAFESLKQKHFPHNPDEPLILLQNSLTSKELKLKAKTANIAGLQVADLLAYPVSQDILRDQGVINSIDSFSGGICSVILNKYSFSKSFSEGG